MGEHSVDIFVPAFPWKQNQQGLMKLSQYLIPVTYVVSWFWSFVLISSTFYVIKRKLI